MSKKIFALFLSLLVLFSVSFTSLAEGSPKIIVTRPGDDGIYVYVQGDPVTSFQVQVGTSIVDSSDATSALPIKTLIVVDNSLEVYSAFVSHAAVENPDETVDNPLPVCEGDTLTPFLQTTINNHKENEQFRIATIGSSVSYLTDYSADYDALNSVVASITYSKHNTSIIGNLYKLVEDIGTNDGSYYRIILVSDCIDDSPYARTYDEFASLERNIQVPIYCVAVSGNGNALAQMDSYIRILNHGARFTSADGNNFADFSGTLASDNSLQCIKALPSVDLFNGSNMGLLLTTTTEFGTFELQSYVNMPLLAVTPSPVPTPSPTPEPTPTSTPTPTPKPTATPVPSPVPSVTPDKNAISLNSIVTIIVLLFSFSVLILIILSIVLFVLSKKVKEVKEMQLLLPAQVKQEPVLLTAATVTEPKEKKSVVTTLKEITSSVNLKKEKPTVNTPKGKERSSVSPAYQNKGVIVFTDVNNSENSYTLQFTEEITIGKGDGCNFRLSDGSLSQLQCKIVRANGIWTLLNYNSVNPTKINNTVVTNDSPIQTGDVLRLGRSYYRIEYKDL